MNDWFDMTLHRLQSEVMEKKKLETMLLDLWRQKEELEKKTAELKKVMQEEQEDVEHLNASSLTAFFYRTIGKFEQKLTKKEEEARAAAIKYDTSEASLEAVKQDIKCYQSRLLEIENCDAEYGAALARKTELIKESGIPQAHKILQLEERLEFLQHQEKEVKEALSVGEQALQIGRDVLKDMSQAKTWSIIDMAGGDLISDVIKYSHLDVVQANVKALQLKLRRFRTELADVTKGISGNIDVEIGDFLHLADYFFDGFFVDWMVYDKIKNGKERAEQTCSQLQGVLKQLEKMKNDLEKKQEQVKTELEQTTIDIDLP